MATYSAHPEVRTPQALEPTVDRVASGIERVIVLTGPDGEPQAALVSLDTLQKLDRDDALDDANHEEEDRAGMHPRESYEALPESPETD